MKSAAEIARGLFQRLSQPSLSEEEKYLQIPKATRIRLLNATGDEFSRQIEKARVNGLTTEALDFIADARATLRVR